MSLPGTEVWLEAISKPKKGEEKEVKVTAVILKKVGKRNTVQTVNMQVAE